jgi:3-oxoacyl-[acyl-carrier-protein] synthase II
MGRRVVITGLGSVCALGVGVDSLWAGVLAGRTNLRPMTHLDASGFRCRLAGEVPGFSAREFVPKHYRKAVKVMARDIELAVGAARCAVLDAGLVTRGVVEEGSDAALTYRPERMGCHIGAGLVSADSEEMAAAMSTARDEHGVFDLRRWGREGMEALTPLWLLKYLPNMLACHVTIIHGAEGPSNTITCGESSGLLSIGESTRVIMRGAADLCFSGGAESKLNCMGILRMDLAGRLAETGEAADGSAFVRPYDPGARGGIMGEGGGILILEADETARARGARIHAEVAGYGAGQSLPGYDDGENDEGYRYAILNALDDAKVRPEEIDAVVPLAASIPELDAAEAGALAAVFGGRMTRGEVPLIHFGANIGNCTAGAGGLQAAVAAKCLAEQMVPARVHLGRPGGGLDAGPAGAKAANLTYILVCTGALGGQNAAVVLRKVEAGERGA